MSETLRKRIGRSTLFFNPSPSSTSIHIRLQSFALYVSISLPYLIHLIVLWCNPSFPLYVSTSFPHFIHLILPFPSSPSSIFCSTSSLHRPRLINSPGVCLLQTRSFTYSGLLLFLRIQWHPFTCLLPGCIFSLY